VPEDNRKYISSITIYNITNYINFALDQAFIIHFMNVNNPEFLIEGIGKSLIYFNFVDKIS